MSYQNWKYTNPGWNNNTPPPLSSSNLNDIASALEKLNISDEQIATIKSYLTDVSGYDQIQNGLGQLISVLATARNQDKEDISDLEDSFNSLKFVTGTYTGNGQTSFTINYGQDGNFVIGFVICANHSYGNRDENNSAGIILSNKIFLWNYGYCIGSNVTIGNNSVTVQNCAYYSSGDYFLTNESGETTRYLMILN